MSQTQVPRSSNSSNRQPGGAWLALGVGLGTCLGAALGYVFHDMSTTLPLGMLFGAAIGLLLDNLPLHRQTDEEQPPADDGGADGDRGR